MVPLVVGAVDEVCASSVVADASEPPGPSLSDSSPCSPVTQPASVRSTTNPDAPSLVIRAAYHARMAAQRL
ncbi:hypothetical protein [Nannocystis pusilla]|uniref:hypothetical protein n=1 Tax=Nannocystis pusilla TaxID=889268 RepID=UPI003B775557